MFRKIAVAFVVFASLGVVGHVPDTLAAPEAVLSTGAGWWIVLGTFSEHANAFQRVDHAAARCGLNAFHALSDQFSEFTPGYHVVVAGPFTTRTGAERKLEIAKTCVPDAFLKHGEYAADPPISIIASTSRAAVPPRSERHAAWEHQVAAEDSPDNYCKQPNVAREVLELWNDLHRQADLRAVDIEHLTTRAHDLTKGTMACHGVFVTTDGRNIIGTLEKRRNVAGEFIYGWKLDPSQDLRQFEEPAYVATPTRPTPPRPSPALSAAATQMAEGEADRRAWESWFRSLSGGMKAGAAWWAAQRSLPKPGSCDHPPQGTASGWAQGCRAAQVRLAPFDARRLSEPAYRIGWNSV